MVLGGLVFIACFMPALIVAGAVRKMPPPLPKPKPAEIVRPGADEPAEPLAPKSEESDMVEPDAVEAPPAEAGSSAIVIPREKPVEMRRPAPGIAPQPESRSDSTQGGNEEKPEPGEEF